MKRTEIIDQIKDIMRRIAPTAQTILFGSEARGDARIDSDIDLLILIDGEKMTLEREEEITLPLYELELKTGVNISPIVMLRKLWENRPFKTPFYYAAVSLLLKYDHQPQTHNGVKTMLGLHFISTGKLPIKIGKIFSTLFEKRHSGDYDDFVYCDKEMLDNLYPQAELFIHTINQLLKEE